ncbi:hypothetical protein FACS1894154_00450 [Betaproteobacteria bacterium]|nr:hypothetical protein AGMMS49543_13330 [Betaproteobacteria bacterium]GHT97333.1 hypothetical protein FACS1894154_00450 [Betaproteobacteria bacterium]GHU10273.1 hypothetical protein AGMMS50225_13300 [Betaproteobacteria bacterium]GHU20718.1 hypothetical protein AGMMS50243_16290 [Betaproteobacteria bacterium]GHU31449.1 hypothetical protein FACS189497_12270 [Betaproteobacteria bacterium]
MRWPILFLSALVLFLQYPLWIKGGWLQAWALDQKLMVLREQNHQLEQRNARLEAEVQDLKSGTEAIEERARYELGLVRAGEIFVQVPQR